jgi:type II secretory pathway predicted ATPase ExeA
MLWVARRQGKADRIEVGMYEGFYGLREKPFSILPDPDVIYWGRAHRMAFAMLEFGVMNNAGFTVITGEIGSGKTTLVRHLLRKIHPATISVGLINNTPQSRDELLQWVLYSLGQHVEGPSAVLLRAFHNFVYSEHQQGRRIILIVDEAQNLREEALESLRMLSNINVDKTQFLQLILVGQPQLKHILSKPDLLQFAQRVSSDFHLRPLSQPEVAQYINFRLAAAGARHHLFSSEATDLIARASAGVPRVINILCDTALVYGFSLSMPQVGPEIVAEVIQDKANYGIFPVNHMASANPVS